VSVESNARTCVEDFHWWRGKPELSESEVELRDLAALRDAVDETIACYVHTFTEYEGMSWVSVAAALAMSPEAAKRRYGRSRR